MVNTKEIYLAERHPNVCFFGTHNPEFGRIAIIAEGLRERHYCLQSCVIPTWGGTSERVAAAKRGIRNPGLAYRLVRSYRALAWSLRHLRDEPDAFLVGYPGQLDVLALRLLRPNARIIFDAFVSIDETLADRNIGTPTSPSRVLARTLDRLAFKMADLAIVDTRAHARRFAASYGLRLDKTVVVPVGAIDHISQAPAPPAAADSATNGTKDFKVLYFGGFVPLHGTSVILGAAHLIGPDNGVHFDFVGDGQDAPLVVDALAGGGLPYVRLLRTWMSESALIEKHILGADLCLGIFADAAKTHDVVPAKLFTSLSCARPVLTGDTVAVREEIMRNASVADPPLLLCEPGNPQSLATAIMHARDDQAGTKRVGSNGRRLFEERFHPAAVVSDLCQALESVSQARPRQ